MLQPYTHEIITDTSGRISTFTNLQMNDINTFKAKYPFNSDITAEKTLFNYFEFLGAQSNSCDLGNLKAHFYKFNGYVDRLEYKRVISHIFRYIEKDLAKQTDTAKRNSDSASDSAFIKLMPADLVTGLLDAWYPHLRDGGIAERF